MLLAAITILIILTLQTTRGYNSEINLIDTATGVKDGRTLIISSGAAIELADICAYDNATEYLSSLVGKELYIDTDSRNESASGNLFVSVVYVDIDKALYRNINKYLVESNYGYIDNEVNDFAPFAWSSSNVSKITVWDNTKGIDASSFEEMRNTLLNSYSSQTITHVGYVLALVVGLLAIFSRWSDLSKFISKSKTRKLILVLALSAAISLTAFFWIRTIYWATLEDQVQVILPKDLDLAVEGTYMGQMESAAIKLLEGAVSNPLKYLASLTPDNLLEMNLVFFVVSFGILFPMVLFSKQIQKKLHNAEWRIRMWWHMRDSHRN